VFAAVDETANDADETLQEFIETLQNAAASSGLVASLVHNLTQAVSRVNYSSLAHFTALMALVGRHETYPACKIGPFFPRVSHLVD